MTSFAPTTNREPTSLLRMAEPEWAALRALFVGRDRHGETGCFARFGWRSVPERLVVTLADLERPRAGEIESGPDKIGIVHPYLRRVVQAATNHSLAIGFIHNHPDGAPPAPSRVDDEMEAGADRRRRGGDAGFVEEVECRGGSPA